jgi:transforming growth factor-beta-induced protein
VADGEAATLEGSAITLSTSMGVMVNDATVTAADIVGSNGVIHVIDKVLVPPTVDLSSL